MSNFDFLNNSQYLNLPGCRVMYENAELAEQAYFSDHRECAMRVRVVLVQFCILVSELKQVQYPDMIFWMGSYWNQQNRYEFIRNFGNENAARIRRTYAIAESFQDREMPKREDVYPQMLRNVFLLLLWLYRELGMKTETSEHDYSVGKIPTDSDPRSVTPEIVYSTGQMLDALKVFFPDCSTETVCGIRRAGDKYLVTDLKGESILEELEVPEPGFFSEGKVQHLRSRLTGIKREFDLKTREFVQNQSACDKQIVLLELQLEEGRTIEDDRLQEDGAERDSLEPEREIARLEEEKGENAKSYGEMLGLLAEKYDEVKEKLEDLLPAEQKKSELQAQMKKMLKQRASQEETFLTDQGRILADAKEAEAELENAVRSMKALNLSNPDGECFTEQIRMDLLEKKMSLESACKQAQKEYELSQKESARVIEQYKNTPNNMGVIQTLLLAGNLRCQKCFDSLDQGEEIRGMLQIIREQLAALEEGITAYRENLSDPEMDACLTQVRANYESMKKELAEGLAQRAEEFAWEKKRYEGLLNTLGESPEESAAVKPEDERIFVDAEEAKGQAERSSANQSEQHIPQEQQKSHRGWQKWIITAVICLALGLLISFLIYEGVLKKIEKGRNTEPAHTAVWMQDSDASERQTEIYWETAV